MDLQQLVAQGSAIQVIVEGSSWRLDETVDEIVASEDWDFAGRMLVSAAEISARQLAQKLIAREAYEPLAVAACLRRQPRRPGEGASTGGGAGVAARVFRDINAEDDAKGVPDYIRADIQEMASTASQTRASAMARDALMDRDPIRQYIIEHVGSAMKTSEAAVNAMVVIARASAWEETRRTTALKIANDPIAVALLARQLRSEDIAEVSRMALLEAVAATFAKEMGRHFQAYADAKDAEGLDFIAEHHPDEQYKASARGWADSIRGSRPGATGAGSDA